MRIDAKALQWMWKQTLWGTIGGMLIAAGLIIYFLRQTPRDDDAIWFSILALLLMPVGLAACYLIKKFIEGLGSA